MVTSSILLRLSLSRPNFGAPLNSFVGIHNYYVTFERAGVSLYVNINDVMVLLML
jgi:hypothetical protein